MPTNNKASVKDLSDKIPTIGFSNAIVNLRNIETDDKIVARSEERINLFI